MYFVIIAGCNKMDPIFVKATLTMEEAEEYLRDKVIPDSNQEEDLDDQVRAYYELEKTQFSRIFPDSFCADVCGHKAFIVYQPDGDLVAIVKRLWDDFIV